MRMSGPMEHPGFFERRGPFSLADVARHIGVELPAGSDAAALVEDVRPLDLAGAADLTFIDNRKYVDALSKTRAGFCLVAPALAGRVPETAQAVISANPYRAFALCLQLFYGDAMRPKAAGFA